MAKAKYCGALLGPRLEIKIQNHKFKTSNSALPAPNYSGFLFLLLRIRRWWGQLASDFDDLARVILDAYNRGQLVGVLGLVLQRVELVQVTIRRSGKLTQRP